MRLTEIALDISRQARYDRPFDISLRMMMMMILMTLNGFTSTRICGDLDRVQLDA